MPIDRTLFDLWVDEPPGGDGTTGTKITTARLASDLLDPIDAAIAAGGGGGADLVFTGNYVIRRNTSDGADTGLIELQGGGATGGSRGSYVKAHGNEHATNPGDAWIVAGNVAGAKVRLIRSDGNTALLLDGATGSISLAYGQVEFPATQNPSSNVNTLDAYKEDNAVTIGDGSGAGLTITQTAQAVALKIGQLVYVSFYITYPATGDGTAAKLNGLPWQSSLSGYAALSVGLFNGSAPLLVNVDNNATTMTFSKVDGSAWTNAMLSGLSMRVSGTYRAAA